MSKFNTSVVYKVTQEAKGKNLEMGSLYFKGVPVTYAQVLKAGKKYQSEDTAYQLNLFINADTMEQLEAIGINKEMAQVGVTKIKKGQRRGELKYPLDETNKDYEGMFAANFSRNTVKRDKDGAYVKDLSPLKVLDTKGNPFTQEVGNGSVCTVKMFAYRNSDGMLVVMLDTVVVIEHVAYNRDDSYFDEELGIYIKTETQGVGANIPDDEDLLDVPAKAAPKQREVKNAPPVSDMLEDIPFNRFMSGKLGYTV